MKAPLPGKALVVVALAGTSVLAVVALRSTGPAAPPSSERAPPLAPPSPERARAPSPELRGACAFEVGDRLGVSVRQRLRWTLDLGQTPGAPRPATVRPVPLRVRTTTDRAIRWRLDLRAIATRPDGSTVFVARLSRPRRDGPSLPALGPSGLDRPFLLRLGKRCDVLDTARRRDTSSEVARIREALVAELSWRLPREPSAAPYDELQRDGRGVLDLAYEPVRVDDGWRLRRRIRAIRDTWPFDPGQPTGQTVNGEGPGLTIAPGDRGWFEALGQQETLLYAEGGVGYGRLELRLNAVRSRALDLPPRVQEPLDGWIWGDLLAVRAAMIEPGPRGPPPLRDMPVGALLEELRKLLALDWLDPAAPVACARDWCRANLDALGGLVEVLRGQDGVGGELRRTLLMGLRLAATRQAAHVLAGLVADPSMVPEVRIGAALVLAPAPDLEGSLIDRLRDLAVSVAPPRSIDGRVAAAATAVLGQVARMQRPQSSARAQRARRIVEDRLTAGGGEERLVAALAGVENSGDDQLAGLLQGMNGNPSTRVRTAVARAIRRMNPITTRELVADWMPFEREPEVRRALARSLVSQIVAHRGSEQAVRAVEALAFEDIGALALAGDPLAGQALQTRLEIEQRAEDSNPEVVRKLLALLARPGPRR